MKFVIPEIEVKKFDVADVLTTSGVEEEVSQKGYVMEGECVGNSSDNLVPNCA